MGRTGLSADDSSPTAQDGNGSVDAKRARAATAPVATVMVSSSSETPQNRRDHEGRQPRWNPPTNRLWGMPPMVAGRDHGRPLFCS